MLTISNILSGNSCKRDNSNSISVTDKYNKNKRAANCGKSFDDMFNNALSVLNTEANTYNNEVPLSGKDLEFLFGVFQG